MERITTNYKGISYTVDMTSLTTITAYCYKVDIYRTNGNFEAWLYHRDYGYKMHMFSMCAEDVSILEFEKIVVESLPRYEKDYIRNLYKLQGGI